MAEEEAKSNTSAPLFEYLKTRIANAFPKLAGPKLDKALATDDVK